MMLINLCSLDAWMHHNFVLSINRLIPLTLCPDRPSRPHHKTQDHKRLEGLPREDAPCVRSEPPRGVSRRLSILQHFHFPSLYGLAKPTG
jgi:hypothetical protein